MAIILEYCDLQLCVLKSGSHPDLLFPRNTNLPTFSLSTAGHGPTGERGHDNSPGSQRGRQRDRPPTQPGYHGAGTGDLREGHLPRGDPLVGRRAQRLPAE